MIVTGTEGEVGLAEDEGVGGLCACAWGRTGEGWGEDGSGCWWWSCE